MFQRILAPLDGSKLAEKSLRYVESLALQYNAEVILGWVVQLRTYGVADFHSIDYGSIALVETAAERERATFYLQQMQEQLLQRKIRTSYQIAEGYSIADVIVSMAKETRADLIVKTTYARLGPSRWLHGNIAASVLQRSPCPLFLVRVSEGEEATRSDDAADGTADGTAAGAAQGSMTRVEG